MSRVHLDMALKAPMSLPRVERELLIYLAIKADDDGTYGRPIVPEELVSATYVNEMGVQRALGALMSRGLVSCDTVGYQLHLE